MTARNVWAVEWRDYMGIGGVAAIFANEDAAQAYARHKESEDADSTTTWRVYEDVVYRSASAALRDEEDDAAEESQKP